MRHVFYVAGLALLLSACAESAGPPRDACPLVSDSAAVFGRAVSADTDSPVGEPQRGRCTWQAEDGSVGANVQIEVTTEGGRDAQMHFEQMVLVMSGMAEGGVTEIADIGDEAQAADLGTQAQIVFRKGEFAVLVDARSQDPTLPRGELAERVARAVAEGLD